jgi:hypothetical protein
LPRRPSGLLERPGAQNGFLERRMASWSSEWPPGAPGAQNGFLELRMVSWSSEWLPGAQNGLLELPGPQNGFLELRMVSWSSEWPPGASWGSEWLPGAQNGFLELRVASWSSEWPPGASWGSEWLFCWAARAPGGGGWQEPCDHRPGLRGVGHVTGSWLSPPPRAPTGGPCELAGSWQLAAGSWLATC